MELVADEAGLLPMRGDEDRAAVERGKEYARKRVALGIKSRLELVRVSTELGMKISKDAIDAAEQGRASEDTYLRYDALVNRLAEIRETAGPEAAGDLTSEDDDIEVTDVGNGTVEIHAKIGGDVDIVAKGPVASIAELTASIRELVREQRGLSKPDAE